MTASCAEQLNSMSAAIMLCYDCGTQQVRHFICHLCSAPVLPKTNCPLSYHEKDVPIQNNARMPPGHQTAECCTNPHTITVSLVMSV